MAAMSRADMPQEDRKDFFLYALCIKIYQIIFKKLLVSLYIFVEKYGLVGI